MDDVVIANVLFVIAKTHVVVGREAMQFHWWPQSHTDGDIAYDRSETCLAKVRSSHSFTQSSPTRRRFSVRRHNVRGTFAPRSARVACEVAPSISTTDLLARGEAMPPKAKSQPLIKGQGSLANYFAGGGITRAPEAPSTPGPSSEGGGASASSSSSNSTGKRKKATPTKTEASKPSTPEIKHLNEKISVKGYTPTPASPSPQKSKAPPVRSRPQTNNSQAAEDDRMSPAAQTARSGRNGGAAEAGKSKYFGKGSKSTEPVVIDDEDEDEDSKPPSKATKSRGGSKRKKVEEDDYEDDEQDDEEDLPPLKSRRSTASSSKQSASRTKSVPDKDAGNHGSPKKGAASSKNGSDDKSIVKQEMSTSKATSNGKSEETDSKAALREARERAAAGPSNPGSKEVPEGKPNCLAGLTFVFTGQLESLAREDGQNLVKRYGAKVTSGPSSKTSFVVLGEGAGPSKMKFIKSNNIKTLDEDGLFDLIRSRGERELDPAAMKKLQQEEAKIVKAAKDLEVSDSGAGTGKKSAQPIDLDLQSLWTVKYAPTKLKDLCGNNGQIELLQEWLTAWPASLRCNFKKPGKKGQNIYRAMLISGPPGIGKTTAAHLVAKLCGYSPIELNASDTRSKKLIEDSLKNVINNKSLDGWYNQGMTGDSNGGKMTIEGITITDRSVLILDEVDGMSGGDRGGIGAINVMIKKTKIPIILIANDKKSQKMKPFSSTAYDLSFTRPKADSVRARLMTIAYREKLKVDKTAMDQLIAAAQSDMRSVINMLSTWGLGQKALSFDESRALGASNIKAGIGNPFTLYGDLASHGMWSSSSNKTLNQKADLYFQESSMIPLFVQENYARQRPHVTGSINDTQQRDLKTLQLMNEAAASISDGDMVDSMIHGPQQHWGLMPLHAVVSTLKPMSLVYGLSAEGSWGAAFPAWLGNYSKQQRLSRAVVELQVKMRLSASGSRWEVREHYAPYMFSSLSKPLLDKGKDGITDVVDMMDDYYLGLEDRDIVLELGIGPNRGDDVLKKINKDVKSAFTRTYNSGSHPIAFHKGDPGVARARAKQLKGDDVPDVEEAIVEDEIFDDESADEMSDDDDIDVGKDKMIKEKKPKGKAAAAASSKAKGSKKK